MIYQSLLPAIEKYSLCMWYGKEHMIICNSTSNSLFLRLIKYLLQSTCVLLFLLTYSFKIGNLYHFGKLLACTSLPTSSNQETISAHLGREPCTAQKPKKKLTDNSISVALLYFCYPISRSWNNHSQLQKYLHNCFEWFQILKY